MKEFDWPCDLRIAHGPHVIVTSEGVRRSRIKKCPGVRAHPDTMIGRQHHG